MIKFESIHNIHRRVTAGKLHDINFYRILDLCLYDVKNDYNLTYDVYDIGSNDTPNICHVHTFRLELSENSRYYINIEFYDKNKFYDIEYSYKVGDIEYGRECLKTHSVDVVLDCIGGISRLVNRSLE